MDEPCGNEIKMLPVLMLPQKFRKSFNLHLEVLEKVRYGPEEDYRKDNQELRLGVEVHSPVTTPTKSIQRGALCCGASHKKCNRNPPYMELRHVAYSHMLSRAAISYAFLPVWAQQQQQAFSDPLCSKDLEFRDGPLGFTLEGSLVVAVETNSQAGQGEDVGKFLGKGDQW